MATCNANYKFKPDILRHFRRIPKLVEPIHTAVEEIVTKSGTPYFSSKDIDEDKPTGSIKI